MANMPLVSVCIPAFNAGRFIGATISSVLAQTLPDFELIISDDASTDDTIARIADFNDPRIRLVRNTANAGIGPNWNRVVREARAPFVKLLCQDDLIYPTCLEKQSAVLSDPSHADIALVCARRDIIDGSGRMRFRPRSLLPTGRINGALAIRRIVRSGTNPVGEPAAVMFRATAFEDIGGFRDAQPYMIDVDLWCRLLRESNLYSQQETLAAFRVSRTSLSSALASTQSYQARHFFRQLAREPGTPVTAIDALLGRAKATLRAPARRLAYRVFFRSAPRK
jgi:glycosyltransferase involved in cell wall biosynthesis